MARRRFRVVQFTGSEIILEEYTDPEDEKARKEAEEETRYQFEAEKLRQKHRAEKLAREERERQAKWNEFLDSFTNSFRYSYGNWNFNTQSRQYEQTTQRSNVRHLSAEELKKIYRDLARKYHPDTGGSVKEMQVLNEMHDKLKGPYAVTVSNVIAKLCSKYTDNDSRRVIEVFHTRIINVVGAENA
jgi:hypothetical protein